MPLLGSAAMLLSFDIEAEAIEEHDRWHTHEHLPERLSIPGFRRGTRWIATDRGPRYMVLYEVESAAKLASEPYLARLTRHSSLPGTTATRFARMPMNFAPCAACRIEEQVN